MFLQFPKAPWTPQVTPPPVDQAHSTAACVGQLMLKLQQVLRDAIIPSFPWLYLR